jgi:integrase/recombinase XerD
MFNCVKLSFYLSTKRKNKVGLAPIYYKVTVNAAEPIERSTGIYIKPEYWDGDKKQVKPSCDLHFEYNATLVNIKSKAILKAVKADDEEIRLTPDDFKKDKKPAVEVPTIMQAAELWQKQLSAENEGHSLGTSISLETRRNKLLEYLKIRGMQNSRVTAITPKLGIDYKKWLLDAGVSPAYAKKCMHILKHAECWGVQEGFIESKKLDDITFKQGKEKRAVYLEPEELEKIIYLSKLEYYKPVAIPFIVQCFTGLSYVDLMRLNQNWVKAFKGVKCLVDERQKTDSTAIIPLFIIVEEIMVGYNWKIPKITLQGYNRLLKKLATVTGIKKNLTTHVGRHTFGMVMLNNGYSLEVVSKMLGHKSIRITERIYARVLPKRIIDETLLLKMPVAKAA